MAILLAERACAQVLSTLQAHLPGQISYIASERDDGLGLPAVGGWSIGRPGKMAADETQVNVWCQSTDYPSWTANLSIGWVYAQASAYESAHDLFVMLRHENRGALSREQMTQRAWRYGAAIMRCLLRNQDMMLSDGASHIQTLLTTEYDDEEFASDRHRISVVQGLRVVLTENSIGEGTVGGGAAPDFDIQIRG